MTVYSNDYGLKSPTHKTMTATGLVKSSTGRLRKIVVSDAKLTPTIELLDNTTNAIPVLVREFALSPFTTYEFGDVTFGTGLYIVIGGSVEATIIYF